MAIVITSNSGKTHYALRQYICDTNADIVDLPIDNVWVGSTAFVIDSGETYMLNSTLNWVKVDLGGGGGGVQIDDSSISTDTAWSSEKIVEQIISTVPDPYDPTQSYAPNTYVIYEGDIYYNENEIITPEPWTPAHWTKLVILEVLDDKMDKVNPTGSGYFSLNRKANTTIGENSIAVGYNCEASGVYSFAEGQSTTASGSGSHAEGGATEAAGTYTHAEGYQTTTTGGNGQGAHAEGYSTSATGRGAHAEGMNTTANSDYGPHAEGQGTVASNQAAHAEGNGTEASGYYSHAEGFRTIASGQSSHAEGANYHYQSTDIYTTASGNAAHAEGQGTTASGNYSHAEGDRTIASGTGSHAEGDRSTASGNYSHAEGQNTIASYGGSHAEGSNTIASGQSSHTEGRYTTANHQSQHVFGEYNVLDDSDAPANAKGNYVEIVGNGTTDNARSNARTLDWSGNETLAGKLTVGAQPTAANDVTTKTYVDGLWNTFITGTILTGEDTLTIQNASITSSTMFDIYSSVYSIVPDEVTVATGSITLSFDTAVESDVTYKIRLIEG